MDADEPDVPEEVEIPLTNELDLHPFAPSETADLVRTWLEEVRGSFTEVTIIHGRGKGVQRTIVRKVLSELDWVTGFHDASRGNWGATVAWLRND